VSLTVARSSGADLIGLPVAQGERYVSRKELAAIMDVSLPTIDRMVREGMPSVTWGLRSRKFLPSRAIAWASTRKQRNAA